MQYPQTLPLAEIRTVLSTVKSGTIKENLPTFAHAAWVIQGYIQGTALGSTTETEAKTGEVTFTLQSTENVVAILESLTDENTVSAQASLPWAAILRFILTQLLENYTA